MTYQTIRYELDGEGILALTLDRPEQLNAVTVWWDPERFEGAPDG